MDEPEVIDVTTEIVGERRQEWRDGFDAGRQIGVRSVLRAKDGGNPDGMTCIEQMAFDLKIHRILNDAMAETAQQREKLLAHWRAEAQWWREEHDRLRDEYHAFTKEMVRRFVK